MIRARTGSAQYSVSQPNGAVEFCHEEIGNGKAMVIGDWWSSFSSTFYILLQYGQSFYAENGGCLQFSKIYAI